MQEHKEFKREFSDNKSENDSNGEDYARSSPVLLDLDVAKKPQQSIASVPTTSSRYLEKTLHIKDVSHINAAEEMALMRRQSLRKRWQEGGSYSRSSGSESVLVMRVPEPETVESHSHLEMLHQTNIKSIQRDSSQSEKGNENCSIH
ncbi:hypothetical protein PV326_011475 [Microctonus aethiopoides]|nr:hypothetical protein PV326_011475 [Microctonus aethiopoides]